MDNQDKCRIELHRLAAETGQEVYKIADKFGINHTKALSLYAESFNKLYNKKNIVFTRTGKYS